MPRFKQENVETVNGKNYYRFTTEGYYENDPRMLERVTNQEDILTQLTFFSKSGYFDRYDIFLKKNNHHPIMEMKREQILKYTPEELQGIDEIAVRVFQDHHLVIYTYDFTLDILTVRCPDGWGERMLRTVPLIRERVPARKKRTARGNRRKRRDTVRGEELDRSQEEIAS